MSFYDCCEPSRAVKGWKRKVAASGAKFKRGEKQWAALQLGEWKSLLLYLNQETLGHKLIYYSFKTGRICKFLNFAAAYYCSGELILLRKKKFK